MSYQKLNAASGSDTEVEASNSSEDNPWKLKGTDEHHLYVSQHGTAYASIDTVSSPSQAALTEEHGRDSLDQNLYQHPSPNNSSASATAGTGSTTGFWGHNKGVVLMVVAQFFGASMATTARLLQTDETNGPPMSTFQVRH